MMNTTDITRTYKLVDGTTRQFNFPQFEKFETYEEIRSYLREQPHENLVTMIQELTMCIELLPTNHPDLHEVVVWRIEARDLVLDR